MLFRAHSLGAVLFLLLGNGLAMAALHGILLLCCIRLNEETLLFSRRRFLPGRWEQGGRIYREKLKINAWKDHVPQYVGKGGFSKARLEKTVSAAYMEQFLRETCRGEWYHSACLSGVVFLLLANPPLWGIGFSALLVTVHGACIAIQRYNRCRLLALRKKISHDHNDHGKNSSDLI